MFCDRIKNPLRVFFLIAIIFLMCLPDIFTVNIQQQLFAQEDKNLLTDTLSIAQSIENLGKYLGKFKVTFYWIVRENDYDGEKDTPLYLENGKLLGFFPHKFVQDFKKESAAELKDGRLISYLKKANKARIVNQLLGYNGYTISPFKSIAVDPKYIPIGSKVYIPALTKLFNHNGTMFANDIGSLIKGNDIDIFVGYKENTKLFLRAGIESSSLVDVYLIE